jgi:hypothetical protein
VEARKKAQQWMEYGKTDAEKIGRTVKITKHTKQTEKKAIQENTKANTRKASKTKNKQRKQNIGKPNKI